MYKVAWTAFEQYRAARKLLFVMRDALGQSPPPTLLQNTARIFSCSKLGCTDDEERAEASSEGSTYSHQRHLWTMTHSYYVVMGGLVLTTESSSTAQMPSTVPRIQSLSATFLANIVRKSPRFIDDLVPNLSKVEIKDKSKANGLGKLLVCCQASWFVIQSVARVCQGVPISLLELNTVAHSLCALLIYLLWWDKPFDIGEPTLIVGGLANEFCALVSLDSLSRVKCQHWPGSNQSPTDRLYITLHPPRSEVDQDSISAEARRQSQQSTLQEGFVRFYAGESIRGFQYKYLFAIPEAQRNALHQLSPLCVDLTLEQRRHFELAGKALGRWGDVQDDMEMTSRIPNWPSMNFKIPFIISVSLAGLIYGAIHLTAWNAPFATSSERLLWRLSGVTLVFSGPIFVINITPYFLVQRWKIAVMLGWDQTREAWRLIRTLYPVRSLIKSLLFLNNILGFLFLGLYLFCRAYLVVECFLNLAHLPEAVYEVAVWSQWLPHFM